MNPLRTIRVLAIVLLGLAAARALFGDWVLAGSLASVALLGLLWAARHDRP